jgi:hypothetical protein
VGIEIRLLYNTDSASTYKSRTFRIPQKPQRRRTFEFRHIVSLEIPAGVMGFLLCSFVPGRNEYEASGSKIWSHFSSVVGFEQLPWTTAGVVVANSDRRSHWLGLCIFRKNQAEKLVSRKDSDGRSGVVGYISPSRTANGERSIRCRTRKFVIARRSS